MLSSRSLSFCCHSLTSTFLVRCYFSIWKSFRCKSQADLTKDPGSVLNPLVMAGKMFLHSSAFFFLFHFLSHSLSKQNVRCMCAQLIQLEIRTNVIYVYRSMVRCVDHPRISVYLNEWTISDDRMRDDAIKWKMKMMNCAWKWLHCILRVIHKIITISLIANSFQSCNCSKISSSKKLTNPLSHTSHYAYLSQMASSIDFYCNSAFIFDASHFMLFIGTSSSSTSSSSVFFQKLHVSMVALYITLTLLPALLIHFRVFILFFSLCFSECCMCILEIPFCVRSSFG